MSIEPITASASFPGGDADLKYASLADVRQRIVGRRVTSVTSADHNVIALTFDDGSVATFTPRGTEGDDLEVRIAH